MNVSNYTYEEVKKEAQLLAAKVIREHVDNEIVTNNYKLGDKEWYALEKVKQRIVELANLGLLI